MKYLDSLKGKTLTIPYNNDLNLIKLLGEFLVEPRPFNVSIYFAPNPLVANAGRKMPNLKKYVDKKGIFNSKKFDADLFDALKLAKSFGFRTNLLLNNVLLGIPHSDNDLKFSIPKIQKYLEKINSYGVLDRITISNPYLLELINWKKLPNVEIKTSVNFQIKGPKTIGLINNLSDHWFDRKIDSLELQKDLLRNMKLLKLIRKQSASNTKFSIIVNEGCLTGCPYQMAHQLYAFSFPHSERKVKQDKISFNIAKCKYITKKDPWRILDANWILPSWLKYYTDLIDEFKLTDREASTDDILYIVKAYTTGEYDKNNICRLVSLLNMEKFVFPESALPKDFFKKVSGGLADDKYYKDVWHQISLLNSGNIHIGLSGLQKDDLHKFIGNN